MLRQPAKESPQRFRSPIQQSEQRSNANVGSRTPSRTPSGFRETGNGQDESSQRPSRNLLHALVRSTAVDQLCTEKTIRRLRNRPSRLVERSEFDRESSSQLGDFGQVGVGSVAAKADVDTGQVRRRLL